jgi:hypothetical protein
MPQQNVKRLSTERFGEDLIRAVSAFGLHRRIDKKSRGFWSNFAEWANNDAQYSRLGGDAKRWSDRYHVAAFRFSPEGKRQAVIGRRALFIAKRKNIPRAVVVGAMGEGTCAGHRLAGLEPWKENTLLHLALALNVSAAELEGDPAFVKDEVVAKPSIPKPTPISTAEYRQLSILPVNATASSMHNRMVAVIEKLRMLAKEKRDANHETLLAFVAYVDGVDALDIIVGNGIGA